MEKDDLKVSLFTNTWQKQPVTISLENFINYVRHGRWKVLTEGHRSCLAKGRTNDAKTIKEGMECITPSGVCHKGHALKNLISLSSLLCIDLDHTDERTKEIFAHACQLPYVAGAFISISGSGIKLMIRIDLEEVRQYPAIYAATAQLVSEVLGFPNDGQCKDITHLCFGSYDPDAYYHADAQSVNGFLPNVNARQTAFPTDYPPTKVHNRVPAAAFVHSFLTLYPSSDGNRNATVFRLGCEASKRNIDREELTAEVVRQMEEDGFREAEIARTVKSAYQRAEAVETHDTAMASPIKSPVKSPKIQNCQLDFSKNEAQAETAEIITGEELREHTPTFPDEVYDLIPDIFKECVQIAKDHREKDGLLLSSITTISSMLPCVVTRYNRRKYRPNLFGIIIAPSGNSKGILTFGGRLNKHYCEYWEKQNKQAEQEYETALQEYNATIHASRKSKEKGTSSPCMHATKEARLRAPEEPRLQFPQIPSDISRSKLILHLINNQPCSSLLTSTEISSVCTARNQDYGHFDDIFCKVFEHESVSSSYKINGQRPLMVESPTLSAFFTGTPSSLPLLFPSTENGMYNRFLVYTYSLPAKWQNVFAEEEVPAEELFDRLSMRFARLVLMLKDSPTEVRLTDEQKLEFNNVFTQLLEETDLQGNDDLIGVVKRYGVMTARLCSIFTAIDKAILGMDTPLIYCSDAYFKAALSIVKCCFEHSKLLISSLKSSSEELKPLQAPDRFTTFLSSLPEEFTKEMAIARGEEMSLSESVVTKLLTKGLKKLIIKRLSHGVYIQKT